jgi:hypothetical protein
MTMKHKLKFLLGVVGLGAALAIASSAYLTRLTQDQIVPLAIKPNMKAGQVIKASFVARYSTDYYLFIEPWQGNQEELSESLLPTDQQVIKNGAVLLRSRAINYTIYKPYNNNIKIKPETSYGGEQEQIAIIRAQKDDIYTVSVLALRNISSNGPNAPVIDIRISPRVIETSGLHELLMYCLATVLVLTSLSSIFLSNR